MKYVYIDDAPPDKQIAPPGSATLLQNTTLAVTTIYIWTYLRHNGSKLQARRVFGTLSFPLCWYALPEQRLSSVTTLPLHITASSTTG